MSGMTEQNEGEVKVNTEEEMKHRGDGVPARMNAIVYNAYGPPDVLSLREVETPVPGKDDVLVEVLATSLNRGDTYMRGGEFFLLRLYSGLRTPKFRIPGSDIAGRVVAVGSHVTAFRVGDEVYGDISGAGFGAFAAFARAPEKVLARKPAGLSFAEAAAVPMAATTALHGLRAKGSVQQGQQVLIHGASGGVGTFAVQIARAMDAEVTAVCSTRHVETVRALGASSVIDYTREDFLSSGRQWDRILVVNGNRSLADYRRGLRPGGVCIISGGSIPSILKAQVFGPLLSLAGNGSIGALQSMPNAEDLRFLSQLIEDGALRPVIERSFALSEAADAFRHFESGHTEGKIVVRTTTSPLAV